MQDDGGRKLLDAVIDAASDDQLNQSFEVLGRISPVDPRTRSGHRRGPWETAAWLASVLRIRPAAPLRPGRYTLAASAARLLTGPIGESWCDASPATPATNAT